MMTSLHPFVVHMTIGVLALAAIGELLLGITAKERFAKMARYALFIGSAAAIFAVLSGGQAMEALWRGAEVPSLAARHQSAGQITMWGIVLLTGIRFLLGENQLFRGIWRWGYYLIMVWVVLWTFRTAAMGSKTALENPNNPLKPESAPLIQPSFE